MALIPRFLNYDSSILSVANSVLKHYGVQPPYSTLPMLDDALARGYRNVVLMIFDGLGVELLTKTLSPDSFLRQHMACSISSVFPPTTCAALTTHRSGLPPIVHGWLGWSCWFQEYGHVIELYRNRDLYTQQPLPIPPVADQLPYETVWEKIDRANNHTIGTHVIYPDTIVPTGATTLPDWCDRIEKACQQSGQQYVFAYWAEPDHTSHNLGPYDSTVQHIIQDLNNRVEELCRTQKDTLFIITADHGHVPVEGVVYIDDCADMADCLSRPLSLDDRVVSIALKPGKEKHFLDLFDRFLSSDFVLFSRQEALDQGLFGFGTPHPRATDFIGDYIITAVGGKLLCQHMPGEKIPDMKGAHAGLTATEVQVPLILVKT